MLLDVLTSGCVRWGDRDPVEIDRHSIERSECREWFFWMWWRSDV